MRQAPQQVGECGRDTDLVVGAQLRDHAVALLHVVHELLLLIESLVEFVESSNQLHLLFVVLALRTLQLFFLLHPKTKRFSTKKNKQYDVMDDTYRFALHTLWCRVTG